MKQTTQTKRSSMRQIDVGDLFSFALKPKSIKRIYHKSIKMIDDLLRNTTLIQALYPVDQVSFYDVLTDLHLVFSEDKISRYLTDKNGLIHEALKACLLANTNELYADLMQQLYDQMIIEIKRFILKEIANDESSSFLVVLDTFDSRLLYQLNPKIKGFIIADDLTVNEKQIAQALDIILTTKEHPISDVDEIEDRAPYQMDSLSVYLPAACLRQAKMITSHWYKGMVYYSEYMFVLKGLMLQENEVNDVYSHLFEMADGKPIYMTVPTFDDQLQLILDPGLRTECHAFSITHHVFKHWVKGLSKAIKKYQPQITFIIPYINSGLDIDFWENEMAVLFAAIEESYPIGMTIETEAALQYCEDFKSMQATIFKLDALIDEYNDYQVTSIFDQHMQLLIDDLKDAHFVYRVKQPRKHLLTGSPLDHPESLRKFINMGFRAFVIPIPSLRQAGVVFNEWEKTRGQFVKNSLL